MRSAGTARAMSENPWAQPAQPADEPPEAAPVVAPIVTPHRGVEAPRNGLAVNQTANRDQPALVVVGCHGGAGESTLAALLPGAAEGSHAWPSPAETTVRVLLCARTSARGLQAASTALAQWMAGAVKTELIGLVLIADAPRKLPRTLRERARIIEGGAPAAWRIPWIPAWREGRLDASDHPRAVRKLLEDLEP